MRQETSVEQVNVTYLTAFGSLPQVTNGKGAMPAWGNVLDDEEIDAVAQYVFETSSAGKW